MKCLLLLVFVAGCRAQPPIPIACQSPKLWEGRRVVYDDSKNFTEYSMFAYDAINMRTRVVEQVEQGKERAFHDTLTLYQEGKEYQIDLSTRKCNVTVPKERFHPIGVPHDAKFFFEAEVGPASIPNEHFTVASFHANYTEDDVRYVALVTLPDCVPVGDNYYNDVTGLIRRRYYDVILGIRDPEAFVPPPECM